MPLKKLLFRPGVAREQTRYASEAIGPVGSATQAVGGWYESEKVRFRSGTPEKIGGWQRISASTFLGLARSLWNWITLTGLNLVGVGTNLKFYIERGGDYNDITPLRSYAGSPVTLNNPFDTTSGSFVINVNATAHGLSTGDIAAFSGAVAVGGIPASVLNTNHKVTVVGVDDYTITVFTTATSTVTGGGGASVLARYTKFTVTLTNPFTATLNSSVLLVTDVDHRCVTGDFVTFNGATGLGGNISAGVLNREYQVAVLTPDTYTINLSVTANATDVSGSPGGGTVFAQYQINVTPDFQVPLTGWGAGTWGTGTWGGTGGGGGVPVSDLRLWSQINFGEDLIFSVRDGSIYYWDATGGVTTRGVALQTLTGASDVPTVQKFTFVSDTSRFVFAFGCNDYGVAVQSPMLVRWSDQENPTNWTPEATNQAGSIQFSRGSELVTCIQTRQEIVVWTDSALYSLQYVGAPAVWRSELLADNISIVGPNTAAVASGVVYWMGVDKFYKYDGRVQTLRCDLRQYIFSDINQSQWQQVFAGTNEGFNEVWWFYCSANSTVVDKYVVYNYVEDIWYYGTMARTAWLDSGLRDYPLAATYSRNLVDHELGVDDNETGTPAPIAASIGSSEFDIDDGHNFGFVWRVIPDLTFRGSTGDLAPQCTMTLIPLVNSGSGYTDPRSTANTSSANIQRTASAPVEEFTGQLYMRVRGRQMIFKVESARLGTTWQLGAPRIDIRSDGRAA
jgi:hypothetical protein